MKIEDIGFGGKGVGRQERKAVFVPFTIDGEEVSVRIVREKRKFAEAALVSVDQPSPHRVEPQCPYFGRCGGCSYQHIDYGHQLEIKSRQVEQTLRRVGRLADVPMRPIIPSPKPYGYRNRIRVHVEQGTVGFYAMESHRLVDVDHCPISAPEVNAALAQLRSKALRDGDYSVSGSGAPRFFGQVNNEVAQEMLALVERLVGDKRELLVDAYCGAGFFSKSLLGRFGRCIGIESNAFAVDQAQRSAGATESYLSGEVEELLGGVLEGSDPSRTTVLLDPPATGVAPRVTDWLLAHRPAEIIYVSCNPATLARDLSALVPAYRLDSVIPLDMFPQTAEIEVVAHLQPV